MFLATVDEAGQPHGRVVLFKGLYQQKGLVWVSSGLSHKADQLQHQPRASLVFYWAGLRRQVRVWGVTERLNWAQGAGYFQQRPRLSQLGAWASFQSQARSPHQFDLDQRVVFWDWSWDQEVAPPPHWGAWVLWPDGWEFWVMGDGRLHQRVKWNTHQGWTWIDP